MKTSCFIVLLHYITFTFFSTMCIIIVYSASKKKGNWNGHDIA